MPIYSRGTTRRIKWRTGWHLCRLSYVITGQATAVINACPAKKSNMEIMKYIFITQTTDKGNTKDQEIYRLQEHVSRKPYSGDRNIAIISDADSMTKRAQNRLFKNLRKRPPAGAVIILLSNNTEKPGINNTLQEFGFSGQCL